MEAPASEGLGLIRLRAGWFVYAALDLEHGPGKPSRQHERSRLPLPAGECIRHCALSYVPYPKTVEARPAGLPRTGADGRGRDLEAVAGHRVPLQGHGAPDGSHFSTDGSDCHKLRWASSERLRNGHHLDLQALRVRVHRLLRALLLVPRRRAGAGVLRPPRRPGQGRPPEAPPCERRGGARIRLRCRLARARTYKNSNSFHLKWKL